MIYARGTTFWHGVRAVGDRVTTLCGRRLTEPQLAGHTRAVFLCRSCTIIIARSGEVLGA